MRKIFMTVAAMAVLAAPGAFAQGSTQSPPSPNSSQSVPEPANSLPPGGQTGTGTTPSQGVTTGTTAATPTPNGAAAAAVPK